MGWDGMDSMDSELVESHFRCGGDQGLSAVRRIHHEDQRRQLQPNELHRVCLSVLLALHAGDHRCALPQVRRDSNQHTHTLYRQPCRNSNQHTRTLRTVIVMQTLDIIMVRHTHHFIHTCFFSSFSHVYNRLYSYTVVRLHVSQQNYFVTLNISNVYTSTLALGHGTSRHSLSSSHSMADSESRWLF